MELMKDNKIELSLNAKDFKKSSQEIKVWLKRFNTGNHTKEEIKNELLEIRNLINDTIIDVMLLDNTHFKKEGDL